MLSEALHAHYFWGDTGDAGGAESGGRFVLGTLGTRFPNSGSDNDAGATGVPSGRIPLASTIDQRQSSSGPGVIPIFSRSDALLNGLASVLR